MGVRDEDIMRGRQQRIRGTLITKSQRQIIQREKDRKREKKMKRTEKR